MLETMEFLRRDFTDTGEDILTLVASSWSSFSLVTSSPMWCSPLTVTSPCPGQDRPSGCGTSAVSMSRPSLPSASTATPPGGPRREWLTGWRTLLTKCLTGNSIFLWCLTKLLISPVQGSCCSSRWSPLCCTTATPPGTGCALPPGPPSRSGTRRARPWWRSSGRVPEFVYHHQEQE